MNITNNNKEIEELIKPIANILVEECAKMKSLSESINKLLKNNLGFKDLNGDKPHKGYKEILESMKNDLSLCNPKRFETERNKLLKRINDNFK